MLNPRSTWLTPAQRWLALTVLLGCSDGSEAGPDATPHEPDDISDAPVYEAAQLDGSSPSESVSVEMESVSEPAELDGPSPSQDASVDAEPVSEPAPIEVGTSLALSDGGRIPSQELVCSYRQSTVADDSLYLQLQYLSGPNSVAFAAYLEDPIPAKQFVATPRDVGRFEFEAFRGDDGYEAELREAEITVRLDDLPAPSSLSDGEVVHLQGVIEIAAFSLPARVAMEAPGEPLDLAPATVAVDCKPRFRLSPVLN
jgi:hypothetical protein